MLNATGKMINSLNQSQIKLDNIIKTILSHKPILARIISRVVDECKGMSLREIENAIEGEVYVNEIYVEPGYSNQISGNSQEDYTEGEGLIKYDIRTYLKLPKKEEECVKILLNIEAQKNEYPGYDIATRAIFYCCRMISSQLETEFSVSAHDLHKYANIKKVYSIWICTESSQNRANTIEKYSINKNMILGENTKTSRYDLLTAVVIYLSKTHKCDCDDELLNLLTILFNETTTAKDKISKLEKEFYLPMEDVESEVDSMLAYTARITKEAEEKGIKKGKTESIKKSIAVFKSCGIKDSVIIEKLITEFNLTKKEAEALMKDY